MQGDATFVRTVIIEAGVFYSAADTTGVSGYPARGIQIPGQH